MGSEMCIRDSYAMGEQVRRRMWGALDAEDADRLYRGYAPLATSLEVPASSWPVDRAAFADYWDDRVARLEVTDDTVPAGTCRAAGLFDVHVADGRVRVVPDPRSGTASAQSSAGPSAAPSGEATAGTVLLDVHAASLLLVGGRSLADARRLGLRAEADAPAEALLDTLLAGPRPSVLDAF